VPRTAGTLSACGGLFSDIVAEFSISLRADTNRFDCALVNRGLERLDAQIDELFAGLGTAADLQEREFFVEARYPYQVWELEVPLRSGRFGGAPDVQQMVEDFHRVHERVFAVAEPGQHIECIYWKGRATARLPKPSLPVLDGRADAPPIASGVGPAWFGGVGAVATPRLRGDAFVPGHELAGPAIIHEPTTTIVVYPGWTATVTETGDYLLEFGGRL
jgi:N-methylhydantoinase A